MADPGPVELMMTGLTISLLLYLLLQNGLKL